MLFSFNQIKSFYAKFYTKCTNAHIFSRSCCCFIPQEECVSKVSCILLSFTYFNNTIISVLSVDTLSQWYIITTVLYLSTTIYYMQKLTRNLQSKILTQQQQGLLFLFIMFGWQECSELQQYYTNWILMMLSFTSVQ